ncbi:MAG: tRNA lysidine(34) synthetase TilS [Clostridia bacterium]|nr:tRNA lysidine(34) synthetase TilS [Clostridia bacterium]
MAIDALTRFELVSPGDRVLCALSGGADSVCLTHLLAQAAQKRGFTVAAAHFSHGLRPESAEQERALCQRLCDRLGLELFCGKGDTAAYAKARGVGTEEAARALRRAFLLETADRWQATSIATGHHLEDSAETLLFNLIRGTGGQGLQGIPPRNGRFIRPLILAEKAEILRYIGEHRLEYADDPTNFTGDNARARMRREVFPALREINPKAAVHLARIALDNWQRDEGLRQQAAELAAGGELSVPRLLAVPEEAAVRALQSAQRACGGRMLERPHIQGLLSLCRGSHPSGEVHLPGSRAVRRYDRLVFTREGSIPVPPPLILRPGETGGFGGWEITFVSGEGELTVRSRREGDVITLPYGTKTVKKLLIERKIPKDLRDTIPILCHNETILAVGDLCTACLPEEKAIEMICRRKEI